MIVFSKFYFRYYKGKELINSIHIKVKKVYFVKKIITNYLQTTLYHLLIILVSCTNYILLYLILFK